jgi:hypothetical protein
VPTADVAQEHTQPEASGQTKKVYTPQSAVTISIMPDQVIDNHSCDFSGRIPPAPNQNQAAQGLAHKGSSVHQRPVRLPAICLALISTPAVLMPSPNQTAPTGGEASRAIPSLAQSQEPLPKRIFWIIPNYRSHPSLKESKTLTSGGKFKIAAQDSFDPGTFLLTGIVAGIGQLSNSTPSYGQGMAGYGRYYGSTYGDFLIGNFMTEGVYPSLLHQDPRYFRRGSGSTWSRLGYAMGQIFVTHGDNRKTQFNYSEIGGNATAVAISNAYNPDNRTAADAVGKLGIQLGIDMAGNILKEFIPDLYRKLGSKKHTTATPALPAVK